MLLLFLSSCDNAKIHHEGSDKLTIRLDSINKRNIQQRYLLIPDSVLVIGNMGCRGLFPENSMEGFKKAIASGVDVITMGLVVSKDKKLVISDLPWMDPKICIDKQGKEIDSVREKRINLFHLSYDKIMQYDCGTKPHPLFTSQAKIPAKKPLLRHVLMEMTALCIEKNIRIPQLIIEIKTSPAMDDIFYPKPETLTEMLYAELKKLRFLNQAIIYSDDIRVLRHFKRISPQTPLLLPVNTKKPFRQNLAALGFMPQYYSCPPAYINSELVNEAHSLGLKIIPSTINDTTEIKHVISQGVDGIITDYPNYFKKQKLN